MSATEVEGSKLSDRALLEHMLARLAGLPDALRQAFTDHLWAMIPSHVVEFGYSANLTSGQAVTAQREYDDWVLIRTIVASVPSGSTGSITFGNSGLTIPVPAGVTTIPFLSIPLAASDARKLTISGGSGGATLLLLTGEQMATTGALGR